MGGYRRYAFTIGQSEKWATTKEVSTVRYTHVDEIKSKDIDYLI
jgi:hypothetical protein